MTAATPTHGRAGSQGEDPPANARAPAAPTADHGADAARLLPPDSPWAGTAHAATAALMSPALGALAARGEVRRYRKGTLLIQEGDQGDTLFIILAGRLRAFSAGDNEREITFGVYGPGEYLGEMSLDDGPRSASVVTLEASTCAVVGRRTLERFIGEEPGFAFELLAKVIRRARAATHSARQLALNDVYGRLRLLLSGLAVAQPDGTLRVTERLTHQEMANRLGCSREMVSRLIKDLERGGYLSQQHPHLVLHRALPQRW